MEPRFFKRGNSAALAAAAFAFKASMEPRFFKRGNTLPARSRALHSLASMEPRFFKRGNPVTPAMPSEPLSGFNGATFFQTWKWAEKPVVATT